MHKFNGEDISNQTQEMFFFIKNRYFNGLGNFNYLFFKKHPSGQAIFREYSLSVPSALQCWVIQGTFREHFKGKGFLKSS